MKPIFHIVIVEIVLGIGHLSEPEAAMELILASDEKLRISVLEKNSAQGATLQLLDSLLPEGLREFTEPNFSGYGKLYNIVPEAIANWLKNNSDLTAAHPRFVGELASKLAESDPQADEQWFRSLPPELAGEVASGSFRPWVAAAPEAALALALQPGTPPEMLAAGVEVWNRSDPQVAYAWMEKI